VLRCASRRQSGGRRRNEWIRGRECILSSAIVAVDELLFKIKIVCGYVIEI